MSPEQKKTGFLRTLLSVLAAMFGVQSERRRATDFTSESPWRFVLVGILMAVVFVLFVLFLVHWALSLSAV